jgi:hypothetical protein
LFLFVPRTLALRRFYQLPAPLSSARAISCSSLPRADVLRFSNKCRTHVDDVCGADYDGDDDDDDTDTDADADGDVFDDDSDADDDDGDDEDDGDADDNWSRVSVLALLPFLGCASLLCHGCSFGVAVADSVVCQDALA